MRRWARESSLSLVFGVLFLLAVIGQVIAGHALYNQEQLDAGLATVSTTRYVFSSDFAVDLLENWQSEFLQFFLYIWLTVWLVQRGSAESKDVGKEGRESDEDQKVGEHAQPDSPRPVHVGGLVEKAYSHSLLLVFGALFLATWAAQAVSGWVTFNEEQLRDLQGAIGFGSYLTSPDFWSRSLQNWQSEFLAVGSMAVFSIWLRERGSPESKPVGSPHDETGGAD